MPQIRFRKTVSLIFLVILIVAVGGTLWWFKRTAAWSQIGSNRGVEAKAAAPDDGRLLLALPEGEREFLWDLEHHGNLLNRFGFRRLGAALAEQDAAALGRILAA